MIDILHHFIVDIPSGISSTKIIFYGTLGFFMFMVITTFAIVGLWNTNKWLLRNLEVKK